MARLLAVLLLGLVVASCGGGSKLRVAATAPAGVQGASEVMAEPIDSAGDNPFTSNVGKDLPDLRPPRGVGGGTGPASYRGGLPGLYGGTRDYATCDAGKLVTFLEENPDKAAAWAGVLGIDVTEIRRYVGRLTPVLLRTDTRVTNHGFVNGRATSLQSVLEAGTAVFVNRYGEPVVKCYCGNPLTPPVLYQAPVYVGPRWPTFQTTHITIIRQSITIVRTYTLYDPDSRSTFERPAGTSGGSDLPTDFNLPPAMTAPPTPPSSTTPPPAQPPPETTPPAQQPPPEAEHPAADFSPNPGQQGDTFVLVVFGFKPGAHLDVTLVRPDGHVEHYPITVGSDTGGRYTFTNTQNVVTGTYNATVTNPDTGATAHASVQVLPKGGG
jgi:hypothetical protein